VLTTVARRFAAYARGNLVARLGGDEFAGLLTMEWWAGDGPDDIPATDDTRLSRAARDLADALAAPMLAGGHSVTLTASVGLVPVRGHVDLAEALRHADAAMYRAKSGGYGVSTRTLGHYRTAHHGTHLAGWFDHHATTSRQLADST
jgi:diguanylate cyclase